MARTLQFVRPGQLPDSWRMFWRGAMESTGLPEGLVIYVLCPGATEPVPAGQMFEGRFVRWSQNDTYVRTMDCPQGIHAAVIDRLVDEGVEYFDLCLPSSAYRARVLDLAGAPLCTFRGEPQRFLPMARWTRIETYTPPYTLDGSDRIDIDILEGI